MTARWQYAHVAREPLPRWYLLSCKLLAGTAVSLLQVYAFLLIAWFWIFLRRRSAISRAAGLDPVGLMLVRSACSFRPDQAAREFRGRDELRDLSDVLCLIRALPAVAVQEGSPMLYYVCQFNPFTTPSS